MRFTKLSSNAFHKTTPLNYLLKFDRIMVKNDIFRRWDDIILIALLSKLSPHMNQGREHLISAKLFESIDWKRIIKSVINKNSFIKFFNLLWKT